MKKLLYVLTLLVVAFSVALSTNALAQESSDEVIVFSMRSDAVTIDPHGTNDQPSTIVRHHIFERLIIRGDDGELVGVLAEDFEQVDDHTYHFYLREGVKFHDGSDFNAEVAAINLRRAMDPAIVAGAGYLLEEVSEVNVVDDYTLEIVTGEVYAPMLSNLSLGISMMQSADVIAEDYENALEEAGLELTLEEYYELRDSNDESFEEIAEAISSYVKQYSEQNPVGTGKLKFESRSTGSETVLSRFDEHWDEPVKYGGIEFKVVPEQGARIAELETGSAHFIMDVDATNMDRVEGMDNASLITAVSPGVLYLGFQTEVEGLDNPLLRRAISHAINKDEIISGVFNDVGTAAKTPVSETMSGYSDAVEGNNYDLDLARELLAEAGYEDGFDATVMVNSADAENINTVLYIQEALSEIGINLTINQVEWGTFLDTAAAGNQELFIMTWTNAAEESDNMFTAMFHSESIGSAANRFRYVNEDLDRLIEEARRETDDEARAELYVDAQNILLEDSPAVFLRHPDYINAHSNDLQGAKLISMGVPDLLDAYFE